jgi:23S rRNA pseudouridine1911/1915/1917 synthase
VSQPLGRALKLRFGASWKRAYELIDRGKVRIDDEVITDRAYLLQLGHSVCVDPHARNIRTELQLEPEWVVYWDDHLVVVNKPAGLLTVPSEGNNGANLEELLRRHLHKSDPRPAQRRSRLGVVHRIDKETSGLLVFSRTWAARDCLDRQFRDHSIHRRYLAVAHGLVPSQRIESQIIQDRGDGMRGSLERMKHPPKNPGFVRRSVTHVECLRQYTDCTLVACRLETGRTHQIRIHLSEAGHPLVGEHAYIRDFQGGQVSDAPRILLHAAELGFRHPNGRWMQWEQPLPSDFERFLSSRKSQDL